MSFPRYPAYKDSGVEWLGEVPEHWETLPLSRTATADKSLFIDGDWIESKDLSDDGIRYLTSGNVGDGYYKEQGQGYISAETFTALNCVEVTPGDVLISRLNLPIGRSCLVPELGGRIVTCVDNVIVRPDADFDRRFLVYRLTAKSHFANMENLARGTTMQRISRSVLGRVRFAFPPLHEQTQIATFLDHETAKIDALVAEQRRLMELLKEKRQAVISHAVTRGLNPNAAMKPSGIEWLGDVPTHWQTRTIAKASTKITNGFVGPTRDILVETGVPYIQATHIKNGRVNFDDGYFVRSDWSAAHSKSILCEGDVLIVQTGAGTGDVGLVSAKEVGYNCHALIIVAPDSTLVHGTYLSAVLQSTYGQEKLTSIETGAMHPHLNCGEVKFVEIPLPPLSEQSEIVSYVNKSAEQFDTLTAEAQRAIDLLQERRTALISAAVTGQIDVRGAVQSL